MARNIKANKIIIKIGTNTITNSRGMLDMNVMDNLTSQIASIKNRNKEVMIVTSGAIGAGMQELALKTKPNEVIMKQVCAAIGQNILMAAYYSLFKKHKIRI